MAATARAARLERDGESSRIGVRLALLSRELDETRAALVARGGAVPVAEATAHQAVLRHDYDGRPHLPPPRPRPPSPRMGPPPPPLPRPTSSRPALSARGGGAGKWCTNTTRPARPPLRPASARSCKLEDLFARGGTIETYGFQFTMPPVS